jgi:hypothetical protein
MKTVFILEHSYELNGHDETKFIGVYSTNEMAESAINRLKYKNGFKYHPDAFVITECELNKDSWTEGFAVTSKFGALCSTSTLVLKTHLIAKPRTVNQKPLTKNILQTL